MKRRTRSACPWGPIPRGEGGHLYAMVIDLCSISLQARITHRSRQHTSIRTLLHIFYDDLTRALTSTQRLTPFISTVAFVSALDPNAFTTRRGTVSHDTTSPCSVFLVHNLAHFPAVLGEGVARFLAHAHAVVVQ